MGSPTNRPPPPSTFPTPARHRYFWREEFGLCISPLSSPLPPRVPPCRAYREATVSVPGVSPSYPGGAASRSRRWSAWLLSPPRWGNTPLWIPGSFSLLSPLRPPLPLNINTHFSVFFFLFFFWFSSPLSFTDSFRIQIRVQKNKNKRPVSARKRPHTGPVVVEITRGRPYNECEQRTDCAGEETKKKLRYLRNYWPPPLPPPCFGSLSGAFQTAFQNSVQKPNDLVRS